MSPFKRFCLLLFMSALPLAPVTATPPRQATDIPYLMAFSDVPAPHFVIERADGSDSRDFATDIMPPDTAIVDGAGWSGTWYAWTAEASNGMQNTGARPYILSADGQTRLAGLDDLNHVSMVWSPTADLLAVAGLVNPPEVVLGESTEFTGVSLTHRIGIFDPAADAFVVYHDLTVPFDINVDLWPAYRLVWTSDGAAVVAFRWTDGLDNISTPDYQLTFYGIGATLPFSEITLPAARLKYTLSDYSDHDPRALVISPTGEVVVTADDGQVGLHNIATNTITPLPLSAGETLSAIEWSANGSQALVQTLLNCDDSDGCPKNVAYRYADATLTEIMPARPAPATLYPAPDFSSAVLVELVDVGWAASYLNLKDGTLTELGILVDIRATPFLNWTGNHRVVIATENGSDEVDFFSAFDLGTAVTLLGQSSLSIPSYAEYIPAIAPQSPVALQTSDKLYRVDMVTRAVTTLSPDSRRYFTSNYGHVTWHATQDYALLFEDALVAGGGAPMYTGVVDAEGTLRRPLGYCLRVTPRCAEWLPNQVDPTTLAPGVDNTPPTPFLTIPMGRWTDELVWSPDVRQIAASGEMRWYGESGFFDVWDVTTGAWVVNLPDVAYDQTVGWPDLQPQVVSRDAPPIDTYPRLLATSPDRSLRVQMNQSPANEGFGDTLEILDATGQPIVSLPEPRMDWHASASIDPFGVWVAVSSAQTPVRLFDATTGAIVYAMPLVYSNAVALSPDGVYLAVAVGTDIQIYGVGELLAAQD